MSVICYRIDCTIILITVSFLNLGRKYRFETYFECPALYSGMKIVDTFVALKFKYHGIKQMTERFISDIRCELHVNTYIISNDQNYLSHTNKQIDLPLWSYGLMPTRNTHVIYSNIDGRLCFVFNFN